MASRWHCGSRPLISCLMLALWWIKCLFVHVWLRKEEGCSKIVMYHHMFASCAFPMELTFITWGFFLPSWRSLSAPLSASALSPVSSVPAMQPVVEQALAGEDEDEEEVGRAVRGRHVYFIVKITFVTLKITANDTMGFARTIMN